jgi:glutamate racemase
VVGNYTQTGNVGVLATRGTVLSESYPIEIAKFFPELRVYQQACPLWVPLIENNEHDKPGADYFVKEYMDLLHEQSPDIDTVLLACTHYPLLKDKIAPCLPPGSRLISQGEIVADQFGGLFASSSGNGNPVQQEWADPVLYDRFDGGFQQSRQHFLRQRAAIDTH